MTAGTGSPRAAGPIVVLARVCAGPAGAQETMSSTAAPGHGSLEPDPCTVAPIGHENDEQWLDRMERQLRVGGCRSAHWIDGPFGQRAGYEQYREASGNIAPSLPWSECDGFTPRVDYDRDLAPDWYMRLTASATFSQVSLGTRGSGNATVLHRLSDRRAMAVQVGFDGETEADVPLREYGVRTTYRQTVFREWLVMELRASLTWPREKPDEPRKPSWGAGVGFETVFGPGSFRGND